MEDSDSGNTANPDNSDKSIGIRSENVSRSAEPGQTIPAVSKDNPDSTRAEVQDPSRVEISDGKWEVKWNFTNPNSYLLDSVILNNGSAELAKINGSIQFSDVSNFGSGIFLNTSTDYLDHLVLGYEQKYRMFIADKNNHRVIELDEGGNHVWQYGQNGTSGTANGLLFGPQSVELVGQNKILITDTLNHRIIMVNQSNLDSIDWEFGVTGTSGSGPNNLDTPTYSTLLENGDILVTDANNHQVIEIDYANKNKGWTYGSGIPGSGNNQLKIPSSAFKLVNGTTLIADRGNHRVIIVDNTKKVLWQYGDPLDPGFGNNQLNSPSFAYMNTNGNILISDWGNHRVIEVDLNRTLHWQYGTSGLSGTGANLLENPEKIYPLPGGNMLIIDGNNHRVLEVDPLKKWVWQYGQNSSFGVSAGKLNLPLDAKRQVSKYMPAGEYTSGVVAAAKPVLWTGFDADLILPPECSIEFYFRIGTTNVPDTSWSPWDGPFTEPAEFKLESRGERYLQFRVIMSSNNKSASPKILAIGFNYQTFKRTGNVTVCNCIETRIIQFGYFTPVIQTNGQIINYYYSTDNGSTWVTVPLNHSLKNVDVSNDMIRIKIEMLTTDYITSPSIDSITINLTTYGSLTRLDVLPVILNISAGEKYEFSAVGYDSRGNILEISPVWSTTIGTMKGAELTAQTKVGTGYVNATAESITGSAFITVVPNDLDVIKVKPERVNVTAGSDRAFTATGYDEYDNEMEIEVVWSTTVGSMTGNVLHAQLNEGQGIVVASNGSKFGVAIVDVKFDFEHPPPEIRGEIPNQVYPEDSKPWQLKLTPFEFDLDDTASNLNWYVTGVNTKLFYVSGEYHKDDILTFTPIPNAVGNTEITLWLEDSSGFSVSKEIWVNLTPVNDKPWINPIPDLTIKKGEEYTFDFSPYIKDIDNDKSDLTIFTFSSLGLNYIRQDGYRAIFDYPLNFEKTRDIITITVSDGSEFSEDLFILNLTNNRPPQFSDERKFPESASFWEDENKTVVNKIDRYFIDPDGLELTYEFISRNIFAKVKNGDLIISSKKPDWYGTDTLLVRARDNGGAFKEAPLFVTVIPVNDGPKIENLPDIDVHYNIDYQLDLSGFISDVDNASSDLVIKTSEKDNIRIDERYPHTLIINYSRIMSGFEFEVNITVSDGLLESSVFLNIYVSDNNPPVIIKNFRPIQFFEDQLLNDYLKLDEYFKDVDGPDVSFKIHNKTISAEIDKNNFVDIWAPAEWYGQDTIMFEAVDNKNSSTFAVVAVTVIPVNDKPIISDIPAQSGNVNALWVLDLKPYVFDPDNSLEELDFELDQPKGYALLHGSSILFNYDQEATEALTVKVSDSYETSSASFVVDFIGGSSGTEKPEDNRSKFEMFATWIFFIIIMAIINTGGLAIYYFKYKGRYKLEDLFLIHANGNLIAHVGGKARMYADNEILSGMLTAIQDFIKDGFSTSSESSSDDWSLDHLKFGDRNIFIERGDYMYVAAVFKGDIGYKMKRELNECLKEIDEKYSGLLKRWSGSLDGLVGINDILEKRFKSLAPKEDRKIYRRDETFEDFAVEEDDRAAGPGKAGITAGGRGTAELPDEKTTRTTKHVTRAMNDSRKTGEAAAEPGKEIHRDIIISYISGIKPSIPRPLSDKEKKKLPVTKPISDKYKEADWRRLNV